MFKNYLRFIFSDLGSIILITVYIFVGALLFQFTEIYSEKIMCSTGIT